MYFDQSDHHDATMKDPIQGCVSADIKGPWPVEKESISIISNSKHMSTHCVLVNAKCQISISWLWNWGSVCKITLKCQFVYTAELYCRGAGVRRPSVVRKLRFLGNCCMDLDQILWEATYTTYPPYLQIWWISPDHFFLFFQNFNFSNFHDFF